MARSPLGASTGIPNHGSQYAPRHGSLPSRLLGVVGRRLASIFPGVALALLVAGAAYGLAAIERKIFGRDWIEALVLAIVIGVAVRSVLPLAARFAARSSATPTAFSSAAASAYFTAGIGFSAKFVLEVAVMLLGATISVETLATNGLALLAAIAGIVVLAITIGFAIGRFLRLPTRLALLVACGNAICGNSAIAAAAPVIDAKGKDVASAIAFTAVLGVVVVLLLPPFGHWLAMSDRQFGVFAGLTVYAVPQVLAATAPVSVISTQIGTLVKLVRVLMLGPVLVLLALLPLRPETSNAACPAAQDGRRNRNSAESGSQRGARRARPPLRHLVPWFVVGFLVLMALRSMALLPGSLMSPINGVSSTLTVVAMAGLGLSVDIRDVTRSGGRVMLSAVLSLAALGILSGAVIHLLAL